MVNTLMRNQNAYAKSKRFFFSTRKYAQSLTISIEVLDFFYKRLKFSIFPKFV